MKMIKGGSVTMGYFFLNQADENGLTAQTINIKYNFVGYIS